MPKIAYKPFDPANVASKLPRPLQWAGGAALQGLSDAFGGQDPAGGIMQAAAPAMPMVSIFKDAEGIPSRALREAGTSTFRDLANKLASYTHISEHFGEVNHTTQLPQALNEFADRYPRVAAHMEPKFGGPMGLTAANITTPNLGGVVAPMPTRFTPLGRSSVSSGDYGRDLAKARNLVFHEGTHAAQALGNSDMGYLYNQANKLPGRYEENPFELMAKARGSEAKVGNLRGLNADIPLRTDTNTSGGPTTAIRMLKKDALRYSNNSLAPTTNSPATSILEMLKDRESRGWNPPKP